jgi:hypothetical protein
LGLFQKYNNGAFHLLGSNPPIPRPFLLLTLRSFPLNMLWRFIRWVIIRNNKFFFRLKNFVWIHFTHLPLLFHSMVYPD